MQDERASVAKVGQVTQQLATFDHANAGVVATLEPESEDGAAAALNVLLSQAMVLVPGKPSVRHPCDFGV